MSYFSGIFRIFRGLFELNLLVWLTRNPHEELCVIIAIIWDMYARIVGSCRIKIEDFSLFIIRIHLSLYLLPSLYPSS